MSLHYKILGGATLDNALFVQIDSGQAVESLLFDCGEACPTALSGAQLQSLDQLFFSHLHMDHIAGFDSYFRCNYNRSSKPNRIWGPPGSAKILQHRMQGFQWNLADQMNSAWLVHEIHDDTVPASRYELREAFAIAHDAGAQEREGLLVKGAGYRVEALTMDHGTPSLAYLVREDERVNIDPEQMQRLGLRPGPWLKALKDPATTHVKIGDEVRDAAPLRSALLTRVPGESIAYLTDFLLDDAAMERLAPFLNGCGTLVCESQYHHADRELAVKNFHMTHLQVAALARRCNVGKLVLIHISERYEKTVWFEMLDEVRAVFPEAYFPEHWPAR